jgi:hypothetical protein
MGGGGRGPHRIEELISPNRVCGGIKESHQDRTVEDFVGCQPFLDVAVASQTHGEAISIGEWGRQLLLLVGS